MSGMARGQCAPSVGAIRERSARPPDPRKLERTWGNDVEKRTKGQAEAEISKALVRFDQEYMGRGPADVRTRIVQDMAIVRLFGVLTPSERALIRAEGLELVKEVRAKLIESGREILGKVAGGILGCEVVGLHSDLTEHEDGRTGDRFRGKRGRTVGVGELRRGVAALPLTAIPHACPIHFGLTGCSAARTLRI